MGELALALIAVLIGALTLRSRTLAFHPEAHAAPASGQTSKMTMVAGIDRTLAVATCVVSAVWLYLVASAPTEMQMGVVQKIFYVHVPSAYAMYLGFALAALGSAWYYVKRDDRADALAVAGAEVGLLFALIVLLTGPLWGRKAWGTYWTWDPRLTTTLLIAMIFCSYVMLRSSGDAGVTERKFASALAMIGAALIPVVHLSVRLWRGQHPQVVTRGGGGLDPGMVPAFLMGFLAVTLLFAVFVRARARLEMQLRMLQTFEEQDFEENR